MASLSTDKNGNRRVLFVDSDGSRKTIYLGNMPKKNAETVKLRVEHILSARKSHSPYDGPTADWVADIDDDLADKLAAVGLIPHRERATLAGFIDSYISKRSDVKPGTAIAYRQGRDSLVEFFGADKPLRSVTPGDADEFRLFLGERYAEATVGRRVKHAKQFFKAAVRRRLIPANPFDEVKGGTQENRSRFYFVTQEATRALLEACPDMEWRLLVGLARFGGLRVPSEAVRLRWVDVDWEAGRLTIHAPKTERHEGKGTRQVPLFPELRELLAEAFDLAEPGVVYVLPTIRNDHRNLRTRLERIILRSGLIPWPRLWQNMRASRATELAEVYPGHVAAAWLGHSERIADAHYRHVLDVHFERAAKTTQIPTQYTPKTGRKPSEAILPNLGFPEESEVLQTCTNVHIGPEGFEPPTKGL